MAIEFEFDCWPPHGRVWVVADDDGYNMEIFAQDHEVVAFSSLIRSDQDRIKSMVKDWLRHFKAMKDKFDEKECSNESRKEEGK